ncbi:LysR family transcriptional regulator [Thioclava sp. GXIMD4216]|uniref:LysR family transcriptional regulator n=1 Tax=Thioclava litoralis TaxID=3076557 RepID=A0ABZ1E084_9RHOB|nr:LysR family transcriptional regulator [Thioclava sp. FTW29]
MTIVWDDLKVFLAVVRMGTLSGAAGQLRLGLATVSRRIERLEAAMGTPLFLRTQTGYRVTEDGAALVERAEDMEAAANSLAGHAQPSREVSGTVRLATAENLATDLILPALPRLQARHPKLCLDLVTDVRTVNLHRRDADLALRMVKPERGHVTLQRLGRLGLGLYAAPSYLAQRTTGGEGAAFDHDAFIMWGEGQSHLAAAIWVEQMLQGRPPVLSTTSLATQVAGCRAGLGLAVLPHFLAQPRGLVCLRRDLGIDQPVWLVTQTDLVQSPRVRAVADFLRDLVETHRAHLAGDAPATC